jgi:acetyl-CoA acetyltransferase
LEDYLRSRYVVRPLRLLDLCLVSDAGICLILRRSDLIGATAHDPVYVAGWGDAAVHDSKLRYLVEDRLRPQFEEAIESALGMAGLTHADIDFFEGYDTASFHLINQLEGYGLTPVGRGLRAWTEGAMELNGELPVNTSGGMLSEVYAHGWSQAVETVRQLRHEGGARQVADARVGLASVATTDSVHPLLLVRG